jgi:predicted DNA binding CopG/RHH family protein
MSAKTKVQSRAMPVIAGTKIKYTNEPLGKVEVIQDFLPSPSELAFREEGVKVTLALSKKSVEFFKLEAEKHQTQYQRMIRRLIDAYVEAQAVAAPTRTRHRDKAQKSGRLG